MIGYSVLALEVDSSGKSTYAERHHHPAPGRGSPVGRRFKDLATDTYTWYADEPEQCLEPVDGQPKRLTCQEGSYPPGDLLVLEQDRRANAGRKGTTRAQFSPRAVRCPGLRRPVRR